MSEKEYYLLTSDAWVPESVTLTGTFSSSGKIVTGSGTTFLSEIQGGDWLINTTTKEAAMVRTIDTDVRLELYKGFTNASGEDVVVVKKDKAKVIYARIKNASGADITIDGQTLPDTDSIEEGKSNKAGFRFKFIKPKYITTTGNTIVNLDHFGTPPQAKQQFIGLLDEYPGAAAAYSLRQLSSSYTGSAIEVRREPDNAVAQIGFVNNELDTASLLAFANGGNGNAFVARWYDQSGNGNDATQGYAANQPQVVSSGSVILENGKPCVSYDGLSSKTLQANLSLTQPFTYFLTRKHNTTATKESLSGGNINAIFDLYLAGLSRMRFGQYLNLSGVPLVQELIYGYADSLTSERQRNVDTVVNGDAGSNGIAFLRIGGSVFGNFDGNIQEIVIYDNDQRTNKSAIQLNTNNYYTIY